MTEYKVAEDGVERRLRGSLLGTAVGDSLGLTYEGLSRKRIERCLHKPMQQTFVFGRGMLSDDTEHTCLIMESLCQCSGDAEQFRDHFSARLRWWFAALPAGVGMATARACLRLWFGRDPRKSGVFSAGNGPAMRSPILGAFFEDTLELVEYTRIATEVTHSDPKALHGAWVVARLAQLAANGQITTPERVLPKVLEGLPDLEPELQSHLEAAVDSVTLGESTREFAARMGWSKRVSGYTLQTVPVAFHACIRYPNDFEQAMAETIGCGGDTDSVAAIVGGVLGASVGEEGIPERWIKRLCDWPRSQSYLRGLSERLARAHRGEVRARDPSYVVCLGRNLVFLAIVLVHVALRFVPVPKRSGSKA